MLLSSTSTPGGTPTSPGNLPAPCGATSRLDNLIPPPVVVLIVGAGMWVTARALPALDLATSARFGVGGVLVAAGLALGGVGIATFRRAGTTVDPVHPSAASTVVTHGVFALTRNPMYVGLAAALAGWAVCLASPPALLGPVAFILFTNRFQIVPEERALEAKFGQAYVDYRRRVPRWLLK